MAHSAPVQLSLSEASGHTSMAEASCTPPHVKKGPLAWNTHSKQCAHTVLSKPFSAATHRSFTWPLSQLRPWRPSVCSCVINAWILLIPFKRICFRLLFSLTPRGGASYSRPLHLISSVYRRVQHVSRFSFWINAAAVWFLFLNASTSNDILSASLARTKKAKLFKSPKKILLFLRIFVGPYNIKSIIVTMHMLEEIWFVFCVIAIKVNTLQGTFFFLFFFIVLR